MAAALNAPQTHALELALHGHNFVLTGSAGTGKSTVVSAIVKELTLAGKKVSLTCSTGIACLVYETNLQATTVHRFAGIEDGRHDPTEIGPWIFNSPKHADVVRRVRETDVLIIDECSMISARTFTLISEVLAMKDPSYMFGNMQIILVGDFKQLPPVKDVIYGDDGSYCFETTFFDKVFPHHIVLTDIVRQSNQTLIDAILEVYSGTVSEETIDYIKSLDRDIECDIHLFARNEFVDDFNRQKILDFPGQLFEFISNDEGEDTRKLVKLTVPKTLWLKIGMPVILLRNLTDRLVNGLRGVIYDIDNDGPTVEFKEAGVTTKLEKCSFEVYNPKLKRNIAIRRQFPIKPAFGLTIHKAQGMTLDKVHIDCRDIFQTGQLGVAMSRVRSPEGLSVTNFHPKQCIGPPLKVLDFLAKTSMAPLDDKSCCRHCKRNDIPETSDAQGQLQVHLDDIDPDVEQEEDFDEEFDKVIKALDLDTNNITLPSDFSCATTINDLKVTNAIRESDKNTNLILESLPLENIETFCKKEFVVISGIINNLNISEPKAVPSKELAAFYVKMKHHLSSLDYKMNSIGMFNHTREPFTDDNMHICFNLHVAVRKYIMKQKTNMYQYENQNLSKRFVTTEAKARVRYVAGYCIAKLRHNYSKKKGTYRFSVSSDSQLIYEECDFSLAILNLLKEEEETVKASTTEEATLADVNRRQNVSRSLTCITDDIFSFFTRLCEACLTLLVSENLSKHGEDLFSYSLNQLSKNKDLCMDFMNKISHELSASQVKTYALKRIVENQDLREKYINKTYTEIVTKFLMVLFAQFRRDLKSSYHVEKTLAHRKQIQISKQKKKVDTQDKNITDKTKRTKQRNIETESAFESIAECSTSAVASSEDNVETTPVQSQSAKKKSKGKGRKPQKRKSVTVHSVSYEDEHGDMVWICPTCKKEDDGITPMIGCDICDEWFHWTCVGILTEPEEDMWFCPACDPVSTGKGLKKRKGRKK